MGWNRLIVELRNHQPTQAASNEVGRGMVIDSGRRQQDEGPKRSVVELELTRHAGYLRRYRHASRVHPFVPLLDSLYLRVGGLPPLE